MKFMRQSKIVKNLLEKMGYENINPKSTPMSQVNKLTSDENDKDVDIRKYKGICYGNKYRS